LEHCFAQTVNWSELLARRVRPPFVPTVVSVSDVIGYVLLAECAFYSLKVNIIIIIITVK